MAKLALDYGDIRVMPQAGLASATLTGSHHAFSLALLPAGLLGDPRWRPGLHVLIDFSQVAEIRLAAADAAQVESSWLRHRETLGPGRWAVVSSSDRHHHSLAPLVRRRALGRKLGLRCFFALDRALDWLDCIERG